MTKFIFFALVLICGKTTLGQCGKPILIIGSKTEYLDANYSLQKTVDEQSTIEINHSEIIITPGNQRKMTGSIKSDSCKWTTSFKEGKSVMKAVFTRDGDTPRNATVTIEGKDGKVNFLMEMDEVPDRKIRVIVDKFEERKL